MTGNITQWVFLTTAKVALCVTVAAGMSLFSPAPAGASSLLHSVKAVPAPKGAVGLCQRYQWACDRSRTATVNEANEILKLASKVNLLVNRSFREISDRKQYGRDEEWALPTGRGGDCEDFALAKKRELIRHGVAPSILLLATGFDRKRNSHAVLVIRTSNGDYVLDNLTDKMKKWNKTGISFIRMQDPSTPTGWTLVMRGGMFPT